MIRLTPYLISIPQRGRQGQCLDYRESYNQQHQKRYAAPPFSMLNRIAITMAWPVHSGMSAAMAWSASGGCRAMMSPTTLPPPLPPPTMHQRTMARQKRTTQEATADPRPPSDETRPSPNAAPPRCAVPRARNRCALPDTFAMVALSVVIIFSTAVLPVPAAWIAGKEAATAVHRPPCPMRGPSLPSLAALPLPVPSMGFARTEMFVMGGSRVSMMMR